MPSHILIRKRKDGSQIYQLNRNTKKGTYRINPGSTQAKFLKKLVLDGFRTFPRTLYPTGYGFKVSGAQLLKPLYDMYGSKLRITLSATKPSAIRRSGSEVHVTINEAALIQVNRSVSEVKRQRASEIRSFVDEFLREQYPRQFKGISADTLKYRPNTIADLLGDEQVIETLSHKDKEALKELYPNLIQDMEFSLRSEKKVRLISDNIKTSQKIYIDKVINEFELKLKSSGSESMWQAFLRSHILTLLNTYASIIEKQSVQIDGKYPDFMLIDAYGYLDVYEIKKPQTSLLKYDSGRNNYYWDAELARAIVQTEKYISCVERNRYELEAKFRKNNMDVRVVRPRGFIIAGRRSDLSSEEMREDFRVLNSSLKNIDVICFDDLLDNIKALFSRLSAEAQSVS
jgi:hypothetical protein